MLPGIVAAGGSVAASVVQYLDNTKVDAKYSLVDNTVTVDSTVAKAFVPGTFALHGLSYLEVRIDTQVGTGGAIGVTIVGDLGDYPEGGDDFGFPNGVGLSGNDDVFANGASHGASGLGAWTSGDVMMIAFNCSTGTIWFGKNGTWDVNPVTDANIGSWAASTRGGAYYPVVAPADVGSVYTMRFEEADFDYSLPGIYRGAREAYVEATTVPSTGAGTDPYWDEVVFLSPWQGVDGTTPTPEDSNLSLAISYVGTGEVDTAQAVAGGDSDASLFVDSGDYASINGSDMGILSGDYTVEGFFRFSAFSGWDGPIGDFRSSDSGSWGFLRNGSTNKIIWVNKDTVVDITSTNAVVVNTDYHIAVCRSGLTTRLFINGVLEVSVTETHRAPINARYTTAFFGRNEFGDPMTGWIDELRITKAARYTAAFTAPSGQFPRS